MARFGSRIALPVLALALIGPGAAHASFHTMVVNEVMLSTGGNANAQFVELVDISDEPFPNDFAPYKLVVFDGAGVKVGAHQITTATLQGRNNTVPFLISTAAADSALASAGDEVLDVALPSPGQACFTNGAAESKVSCVAWGCVATPVGGATNFQAPADGQSLQRQGAASSTFHVAAPTAKTANVAGTAAGACSAG